MNSKNPPIRIKYSEVNRGAAKGDDTVEAVVVAADGLLRPYSKMNVRC